MKMTPEYLMVRSNAIVMDKALRRLSDDLAILAAHGIVSEHDALTLVSKFAYGIADYLADHLDIQEANTVMDELCKEVD